MGQLQTGIGRLWWGWTKHRQNYINYILSKLYERPVVVAPAHVVGVAGVAVLWVWQGGQRQWLMVRPKESSDTRARFVSCLGVGPHPEMSSALTAALRAQLGATFTRLLPAGSLAADAIAAAPLLTMTDEDTGSQLPLQTLAWVAEIRPHQLDTLQLAAPLELVLVAENAMGSAQISPTHRLIWQAVQRHVPKAKSTKPREDGVALLEDEGRPTAENSLRKGGRVLH
jgi:hypothetical protein